MHEEVLRTKRLLRWPMLVGGLLTGTIGIGHIFMPTLGYDDSVPSSMNPIVRDHFYYLGTYAICAFLLSFAALSIYFSRVDYFPASRFVCSLMAAFWLARLILEIVYPVELRIFFLEPPNSVLMPVIFLLACIYSISALVGWMTSRIED